ncbi:TdeIII family type II restriction endonuclease [Methanoplanus endosymbiosus]|uniref:type II site-specific deoxyribonuclease n=1 Tax=Methanoplanus endosymbiosus TaxID=33865 RepID=A0A9E7TJA5_9EURY|nr:TdeIII family type II restriction endonuclease [Methanoplanus endosymbiosus]UUX91545.1 TdeIII family type II restriction endonuclease [Methanoplanus endosymbiosus]
MSDPNKMKDDIQIVIKDMMDRIMDKVLCSDPFVKETHHLKKPLYAALVPDEIFKGSHFERRFVTPFGKVWEKLAVVAATNGMGYGTTGYRIDGMIREKRLNRIAETLNRLEHATKENERIRPDWNRELTYIKKGRGDLIPVSVVCDLYVEDRSNGGRYAFELKAPLPNSDQTKVSKEKILKLHCMEPPVVDSAYFALPYNPYGTRENYSWSFPARWFDMKNDDVVLIGNDFWDYIGGKGTYDAFISAVNEIGPDYKEKIYRDYLRITPPDGYNSEFDLLSEPKREYDSR